MTIWFTSDLHYGHKNIAGPKVSKWESGYRDFDSVEDMNDCLVNNLNSLVKPTDVIYFLGDWAFGGHENIRVARERIKCDTIYFCEGNHDQKIWQYRDLFAWVKPIWQGKIGGTYFFLHHFAQRVWEHSHHGSIHLYGHSHSTLADDPNSYSMDVGMDTSLFGHKKYTPYSYDEILHIMDTYKKCIPVDHHRIGVD